MVAAGVWVPSIIAVIVILFEKKSPYHRDGWSWSILARSFMNYGGKSIFRLTCPLSTRSLAQIKGTLSLEHYSPFDP
jgi:hypothetical protein